MGICNCTNLGIRPFAQMEESSISAVAEEWQLLIHLDELSMVIFIYFLESLWS